jgi:hypothetical protein
MIGLSACGSSHHSSGSNDIYCARAKAVSSAVQGLQENSWQGALDSWGTAAAAWKNLADVAPSNLRYPHDQLAAAAAYVDARLRAQRPPKDAKASVVAIAKIVGEGAAKYGSLDTESAAVSSYAQQTCGISIGQ